MIELCRGLSKQRKPLQGQGDLCWARKSSRLPRCYIQKACRGHPVTLRVRVREGAQRKNTAVPTLSAYQCPSPATFLPTFSKAYELASLTDSILKSRDITLPTKVCLVKAMVFHVWMWELDYKKSWGLKNWCFWTVVLEKTLESPLDCKEIQSVHPKGDQSWIFIGRTDDEAETPILWPPDAKSWLIGKDPDAGKDWGQEKGTTEDEMVGQHHRLNGHGFGWTPGVGDGQWGLACCDSWGCKESDTTKWLNWTELFLQKYLNTQYLLCNRHCPGSEPDKIQHLTSWSLNLYYSKYNRTSFSMLS